MDRIGDIYRNLTRRADVIVTTVGARHKCQQAGVWIRIPNNDEVDVLAARVDEMELIITRFQRMKPQTFDGDESSSDAECENPEI
ncbi:BAHD family acyltransferase, clade V [Dorcoceras hygrometricum]|uniref:BAHD family acyltransferase, clade V n=1 Tax=Dorcoceras hygrometricum TaxID=472368 RepID=A0A2Z7D6T7_9LAMI|nr:BAHD family acyltransferase, clade V [Dorcoceras hygrometricum]